MNRAAGNPPLLPSSELKGRSLLKLQDFSAEEIGSLLSLSSQLKSNRKNGSEIPQLGGKVVALIFEKNSTRTRSAFEVAMLHQGGYTTYLGPTGTHIGKKESIADTARVLGGMYDAIQYRGKAQKIVEELAENAGVPVYNGLTDEFHPTQILADFLTMQEHCPKPLSQQVLTYLGDGANNMGNSLLVGAAKMGIDFRMACPGSLFPDKALVEQCEEEAEKSGAKLGFYEDPLEAVRGSDFLYTDVWVSMGQSQALWAQRQKELLPYRVDSALMQSTQNSSTKFLHCLPAFHDTKTKLGLQFFEETGLTGIEVDDEVFSGPQSIVFEQSENRLHSIKAILVSTLA